VRCQAILGFGECFRNGVVSELIPFQGRDFFLHVAAFLLDVFLMNYQATTSSNFDDIFLIKLFQRMTYAVLRCKPGSYAASVL